MKKENSTQSISYRIALGGIVSSLCMLCMFLTGVFPMFYLLLPMASSALIAIMAIETSPYWGLITYISVGLLSMFITPNKDAAIVFLLFFGHYPLLRPLIHKIPWKPIAFLLCMGVFNAAVLSFFWITVYLFGADELLESLGDYGKYGGWVILGIANVMFISYDTIMASFPVLYRTKLKSRIFPKR